jgi:hypothetical protein
MAAIGEATQTGAAERLMRTSNAAAVTLHADRDFHEASQHLGRVLDDVYPQPRRHSAVGYLTPAAFEPHWLQPPITVSVKFETP